MAGWPQTWEKVLPPLKHGHGQSISPPAASGGGSLCFSAERKKRRHRGAGGSARFSCFCHTVAPARGGHDSTPCWQDPSGALCP